MELLERNKGCTITIGDINLQVYNSIGYGGTCDIYYCSFDSKKYAAKFLKPKQIYGSKNAYKAAKACLYHESRTLENLNHPNIVTLIQPSVKGQMRTNEITMSAHFYILELLEGGDLISYAQIEPLTENELRYYGLQIIEALIYLHSKGLAHRDIKPENIVLSNDFSCAKLIDFGFCCFSDEHYGTKPKGTLEYLSPEVNALLPCDLNKSDVFSLGVTFFALLTGRFPCRERCTQCDPFYRLVCEKRYKDFWQKAEKVVILSESCKLLLQDMLHQGASKRPTMEKLKEYEWFNVKGDIKEEVIKRMSKRKRQAQ